MENWTLRNWAIVGLVLGIVDVRRVEKPPTTILFLERWTGSGRSPRLSSEVELSQR